MKNSESDYGCKECSFKCKSLNELQIHIKDNHAVTPQSSKPSVTPNEQSVTPMKTDVTIKVLKHFKCNFCNFHGQRIKEMSNHAKENHEGEWFNMKNWNPFEECEYDIAV